MVLNNDYSIYSTALSLLYVLKDTPDFSTISKLSLVLDRNNFENFIDYFGGSTIKVPTREEVNIALKSIIYYQARYVDHKSLEQSKAISGIDHESMVKVNSMSKAIRDLFSKINENQYNDNNKHN